VSWQIPARKDNPTGKNYNGERPGKGIVVMPAALEDPGEAGTCARVRTSRGISGTEDAGYEDKEKQVGLYPAARYSYPQPHPPVLSPKASSIPPLLASSFSLAH
jgi:hypothetical protein